VGRLDTWIGLEIDRELTLCDHPERVDLLGSVGEAELLELYRGATALIVTSRHEGFGLPALEAMATGTPVVAFRNSSTAEVVEGGGELVEDGDIVAVANAVAEIIDDPARRTALSQSGMRRAAGFTWRRCAEVHAQAFVEAAS
jgi:alpha-1,3-rhamnosyl/mannosyltransferase